MNPSIKAPMVPAFTLAALLLALPALGAPTHDAGHKPAQHRVADFAKATALVSPETAVSETPETDGLSRKDEECNFGCIDH